MIQLIYIYVELCEDGRVRIEGSTSLLRGVLEVCANSTWVAVCNNFWKDINAAVVCRQLGHSPYGSLFYIIAAKFQFNNNCNRFNCKW